MKRRLKLQIRSIIFIALCVSCACVSFAYGAEASGAERKKAKQELVDKGNVLYREGKYEAASQSWQMALRLDPWNGKIKRLIKDADAKAVRAAKGDVRLINIQNPPHEVLKVWTLDECVNTAVRNHLPLQIAEKNIKLGEMRLFEARRNMLPTVLMQWQQTLGKVNARNYIGRKEFIEGTQPLYHGGELWFTMRQAETNLKIVKEESNRVRNDLVLQVKKNYYALAKSDENLRIQNKLKEEVYGIYEIVKKAFEANITSKLEYLNVSSQISQIDYQFASAEGDVEVAELILKQTMNLDPNERVVIEPKLDFRSVAVDWEEALRIAMVHRPEIKINSMMVEYYSYGNSIAKAKGWPKVDLMGNWGLAKESYLGIDNGMIINNLGLQTKDPDRRMEQQWYGGFKASMPIYGNTVEYQYTREQWQPVIASFQGTEAETKTVKVNILDNLKYYSDKQAADIDLDRARQEFIKAKQDTTLEIKESVFAYEKALIQLETAERKVLYTSQDLEIKRFKASMGETTNADASGPGSDVIDSMIRTAQEKFSYTSALADCHIGLAAINKAVGIENYYRMPPEAGKK